MAVSMAVSMVGIVSSRDARPRARAGSSLGHTCGSVGCRYLRFSQDTDEVSSGRSDLPSCHPAVSGSALDEARLRKSVTSKSESVTSIPSFPAMAEGSRVDLQAADFGKVLPGYVQTTSPSAFLKQQLFSRMAWDGSDDEWDDENIEKKLEANRLAKEKAERGEDSSSEEEEKKAPPKVKKSTWEDSDDEEEKPEAATKAKPQASDEDDDWEAWDDEDDGKVEERLKAQLKEKEKQRKREAGEDTESEEEKPKEKPKAAPKKKAPTQKTEEAKPKVDPSQVPLADPKAERERLRKLEEDRDARLGADLFSGFEKKESLLEKEKREKAEAAAAKKAAAKPKATIIDEFDNLELKLSTDVDSLCAKCLNKFETSSLQKGGPQRFLSNLIKSLESSFDTADLASLDKSLEQLVKDKKTTKANATLTKDNKASTKINKNTKFNKQSEWEDVYGGGEDDEDWTQEEWDAWYAEQEKAGGGKWK
eukprot:Skav227147  [mRNA]  locus=scaffold133:612671:616949:+ [translate_table: standard]